VNEIRDTGTFAVYIGAVYTIDELIEIYKKYKCIVGVIEAQPELHLARGLAQRFKGMFLFRYTHGFKDQVDKDKIIKCDRTASIDAVKAKILTMQLSLPMNIESIPEYYDHMMANTRVFDDNKNEYYWTEGSDPDHFLHAEVFASKAEWLLKGYAQRIS
jgi:hypothetical protein